MRLITVKNSIVCLIMLASCAAPEEPAALKSSGTSLSEGKSKNKVGAESGVALNYGGALVGDEATRAEVKKCVDQGKFYERRDNPKPGCTDIKLAAISCTDSTITSIMDAKDKSAFEGFMKADLAGFTLDQCMDCSQPVGNPYCEGTPTKKVKDPGVRLFLVKELSNMIEIKTVYIYK